MDLNQFLEEFNMWRNLSRKKDEDIDNLHKELCCAEKQKESFQNCCTNLQNEISEIVDSISALHVSFSKLDDKEAEKSVLVNEKEDLEKSLKEQKKLYEDQLDEIEGLKKAHKESIEDIKKQVEIKVLEKSQIYSAMLGENDNTIAELQQQIVKLKSENEQTILHIKIENEEKLRKIKEQASKGKNQISSSFRSDDIFRKKYLKLEKEYKEEVSKLKEQCEYLQSQNEILKTQTRAPLCSMLQKSLGKRTFDETIDSPNYSNDSEMRLPEVEKDAAMAISDTYKKMKVSCDKENLGVNISKMTKMVQPQAQKTTRKLYDIRNNYFTR